MAGSADLIGDATVEVANAGECLAHLVHAPADVGQRIQYGFRRGAVGGEMGSAVGRQIVEFSRTFMLDASVADLFEESQCRIDHAGARTVEAAGALLDRLNELITVARALLDQGQDKKLEVGRTKPAGAR